MSLPKNRFPSLGFQRLPVHSERMESLDDCTPAGHIITVQSGYMLCVMCYVLRDPLMPPFVYYYIIYNKTLSITFFTFLSSCRVLYCSVPKLCQHPAALRAGSLLTQPLPACVVLAGLLLGPCCTPCVLATAVLLLAGSQLTSSAATSPHSCLGKPTRSQCCSRSLSLWRL